MSNDVPTSPYGVTITATVHVNGRTYEASQPIDEMVWAQGPEVQKLLTDRLRRELAHRVADALEPQVTITKSASTATREALAQFDAEHDHFYGHPEH